MEVKGSGAITVWLSTPKRNKTQINKNRRHYFAFLGIFVTERSNKKKKKNTNHKNRQHHFAYLGIFENSALTQQLFLLAGIIGKIL